MEHWNNLLGLKITEIIETIPNIKEIENPNITLLLPFENANIIFSLINVFVNYDDYPIEIFINNKPNDNTIELYYNKDLIGEILMLDFQPRGKNLTKEQKLESMEKAKNAVANFMIETEKYVTH